MNAYHEANREANRRHWDAAAAAWRELRERDGLWKRCASEPELAFEGEALQQIRRFYPVLSGRQAHSWWAECRWAIININGGRRAISS